MPAKLLKVTVKRSKWLRGDENTSMLLDRAGKMCCLGFACITAGLKKKDIVGIGTPSEIGYGRLPKSLAKLTTKEFDSKICSNLMSANDREYFEDVREADIKKLGKKAGLAFTFVD